MANERITANMDMFKIILEMSDNNLGAIACLIEMFCSDPMAILDILWFDSMEIYGSKIYIFWNDCCNRDIVKLKQTIQYLRSGKVSKAQIHENLDRVCVVSFI